MKNNIPTEQRDMAGVYKITNEVNGKLYIGRTNCFINRFRSHLSSLKSGKSSSVILQSAVIKHGLDNFSFSVIEVCDNYDVREIQIIEELKPHYNLVIETQYKRVLSDETRKKLSNAQKRRDKSTLGPRRGVKHNVTKFKKVQSFNPVTNETLIHNSVRDAAKHFGLTERTVYQRCYTTNLPENVSFSYITSQNP